MEKTEKELEIKTEFNLKPGEKIDVDGGTIEITKDGHLVKTTKTGQVLDFNPANGGGF